MPIPESAASETFRVRRARLLILIVAYNAETTISRVLARVPHTLAEEYDVEVLVLDDSSQDLTFEKSRDVQQAGSLPFRLHVLFNPVNQGYGGNQKIGYHFAIEHGFDFVALVHGDGQYAPECLPDLVRPLRDGAADAVFGSRMLTRGGARRGGMPLYKYVGNRILSWFENRMLGTALSEFHSGYRIYSVEALKKIPFALNTNDFHFDTEIIVQLVLARQRIAELPIPTYYGNEICRVNGMKYAWDVSKAVLVARSQQLGLFYDRRYDCVPAATRHAQYEAKLDYESPHSVATTLVPEGARVLDLGCAGGHVAAMLRRVRRCTVTGVDKFPLAPGVQLDAFIQHDLDKGLPPVDLAAYDVVLLLDVIEHLASPETFIEQLREALSYAADTRVLVSTANIGFVINRMMLLFGQFNYGKRGILDLTHTRLFTFASFRRLFEQGGFRVLSARGIAGPFALAIRNRRLSALAARVNRWLIAVAPRLFSYQMFLVVEPLPSLARLLRTAREQSAARADAGVRRAAGGS